MNKMTKPEMDVVRFQESDVIVASLYLGGVQDKAHNNGYALWNGTKYGAGGENIFDLYPLIPGGNSGLINLAEGSVASITTIDNVFEYDQSEGMENVYTANDGFYNYDVATNTWLFSHQ